MASIGFFLLVLAAATFHAQWQSANGSDSGSGGGFSVIGGNGSASGTNCVNCGVTVPSTNAKCPPGWTYFNAQYNASWDNAQSYCEANGANLASIHSLAENNFVEALPADNTFITSQPQYSNVNEMTWIGLRAAPSTLAFAWIDGTPYDYNKWRTDTVPVQPNRAGHNAEFDCAELLNVFYNNTWNQYNCMAVMLSFVCKRPANATPSQVNKTK